MGSEVSVIISAYNSLPLLGPTLDSILGQTLPPAEVIVVDDGSDRQDIVGFVASYGSDRLRCIRTTNRGANAARNTGVEAARYDWVAFSDADDLWLPRKLERQVNLVQAAAGCGICLTDYQVLYPEGLAPETHFSFAPPGYWEKGRRDFGDVGFVIERNMLEDYLIFQPGITSTVLMSRQQFEKVGGWDEVTGGSSGNDFAFHLVCADHPPIGFVPEVLMHYRRHGTNHSPPDFRQSWAGVGILRRMLDNHPVVRGHEQAFQDAIDRTTLDCIWNAFYRERLDLFHDYWKYVPQDRISPALRLRYAAAMIPHPLHGVLRRGIRALKGLPAAIG